MGRQFHQVTPIRQMSEHQMMVCVQEPCWGAELVPSDLLNPCEGNYFASVSIRVCHCVASPNQHHKPLCPHHSSPLLAAGHHRCHVSLYWSQMNLQVSERNVWDDSRDKMAKLAGAEAKGKAKIDMVTDYKMGNYSKWEQSPKTLPRTPGTPSPGHSPTHSLLQKLGPSWICSLCWFHASEKNWSCWLIKDKNRWWRSEMWYTLLMSRPCWSSKAMKISDQVALTLAVPSTQRHSIHTLCTLLRS